jgi:hypothetical protein
MSVVSRRAAAARSLVLPLLAWLLGGFALGATAGALAAPSAAQEPAGEAAAGAAPTGEAAPTSTASAAVTATDAQAFLGYWLLTVRVGQSSQRFGLLLDDEGADGNELRGELISGFGKMTAEKFALQDDALAFDLASDVGRFRVEIRVEGDDLTGVFGDTAGSMRAEFSGEKSDRLAFQRFLVPENESRIARGDRMVRLRFVSPAADGPDFAQIATAKPGEVVRFVDDMAIKLTTDLPLVFGHAQGAPREPAGTLEVPIENVAAGYPGVYSLWLKRTAEGWSLVFNHKPDVWGTQHRPEADLGEVPLELRSAETPAGRLHASIEETAAGRGEALLRLTWGPHAWSVPFRIDPPQEAAPSGG